MTSRTVWALRHRETGLWLTSQLDDSGQPVLTSDPARAVTRLFETSMPRLISDAIAAGIPVADYETVSFVLTHGKST